jgi:hypothetical protein
MTAGAGSLLLLFLPLLAAGCAGADRPDHPDRPAASSDSPAAGAGTAEGVAGRVTDAHGKPLAGVAVHPRSLAQPSQPIPELAVRSEDDGRYTWTLKPGDYEITFTADGYSPTTQRATVSPGRMTALDVVLQPAP